MIPHTILTLDFETRSRVNIKKSGVHRYAMDPSTDALCLGYGVNEDEPELWVPGRPLPSMIANMIRDPNVQFRAWNAPFEIAIWFYIMVMRYGWPELPLERWGDTMCDAAYCGFPLKLEKCGPALGVPVLKSAAGTRLINKCSKPQKNGVFLEYNNDPRTFQALYEYCLQDVRAEAAIFNALPDHVHNHPREERIQFLTWKMNQRGLPIDLPTVHTIVAVVDEYVQQLDERVQELTEGRLNSARQRDALLEELSITLPNLQKETVENTLKAAAYLLTEYDEELLTIRSEINHAAVAKFKRILQQVCIDDTVKDNIQYHAASTGRDGGRGYQMQNLVRGTADKPEEQIYMFNTWSIDDLDLVAPVLTQASLLVRPVIKAPNDKKLIVGDLSQVEARGTAWTAMEEDILNDFRAGIDPYISQASKMYSVDMALVSPLQRQYGKLATLACGYQGSHKALTDFAALYGLELERKEAADVVRKFRNSRPKLVQAWYNWAEASIAAVEDAGTPYKVQECPYAMFQMKGEQLTLRLPNGKLLWYPYAKVESVTVRYEDPETGKIKTFKTRAVTCMKLRKNQWIRMGISGGNFFQNFVQAICREIIMDGVIRCEEANYPVIGRVHDEVICLVDDTPDWTAEHVNSMLTVVPEWAVGFPLKAKTTEERRYGK